MPSWGSFPSEKSKQQRKPPPLGTDKNKAAYWEFNEVGRPSDSRSTNRSSTKGRSSSLKHPLPTIPAKEGKRVTISRERPDEMR